MKCKIRKIEVEEEGATIEITNPAQIIHVEPYKIEVGMKSNKDGTTGGIVEKKMLKIYYLSDIKEAD